MWRTWVLRGIGIAFGIILILLTSQYPDATRAFISSTFNVTDAEVVSSIIVGFILIASAALILVGTDYILDKLGYRFLVITKKKQPEPSESLAKNELRKGVAFYPKRSEEVLKDFVKQAQSEFIVIATEYGDLGYRESLLLDLLHKGVRVSFYVLDPDAEVLKMAEQCKIITSGTKSTAIGHIEKFCIFKKNKLSKDEQQRFNLYLYKEPPIHSMLVIDRDKDHVKIQIESYLYDTEYPKEQRPSIVISKQSDGFANYLRTVDWMVKNHHIPYVCPYEVTATPSS